MGAAINMLVPRETEVSDASLPYDQIGYGTPLPFHIPNTVQENVTLKVPALNWNRVQNITFNFLGF